MDILEKGQYMGETVGSYKNDYFAVKGSLHQKFETGFHFHNCAYLSILLNGTYIETSKSNSKRIFPGEIIFRPANYIHKNFFETNKIKCLNIEFDDDWFEKSDIQKLQFAPVINQISNFPFLFQLIIDFIKYNKIDMAEDIFIDFINQLQKETTYLNPSWFQKLINILDNEIETVHSLMSLAERVHVHPNYMARIFKEMKGMSIGQYQVEKKLNFATRKILNSSNNIAAISAESGFFDEAHFIRTFKAKYSITPHQFRLLLK